MGRSALYAFVVAFVLRLSWAMAIPVVPLSDGHAYDVFAQNIAQGYGYGWEPYKPSAYWPVGTSAIYAFFYRAFGHHYLVVALFQVVVGLAVVVAATHLARRWFDARVAVATAWILACWPLLIEYTTLLASELYFLLFVMAAYWFAGAPRAAWARGMLSGVFLAAANYVRPVALLLPPLLYAAEALERPRRRAAIFACAICVVSTAACIAPWTVRNWFAFDRFVLMSTNGGRVLWMGNNPDADTGYMLEPKLNVDNEADFDRILGERATDYILREPGAFIRRSIKKALVLHDRESIGITWNEKGIASAFGERALTPLKALSSAYWWVTLALAIGGTIALFRRFGWLLIIACPPVAAWFYFTLVHSISIAGDRYHIPSIPYIAMLAAYAVDRLRAWRAAEPHSHTGRSAHAS